MFISEAGLLLPAHLWLQRQGRGEKKNPNPGLRQRGVSPSHCSPQAQHKRHGQTHQSPRSLLSSLQKNKNKKGKKYKEGWEGEGGALDFPPPFLTKRQNKNQTRNHQGGEARGGKIPSVSRSLALLLFLLGVQPSPEARWKGRGESLQAKMGRKLEVAVLATNNINTTIKGRPRLLSASSESPALGVGDGSAGPQRPRAPSPTTGHGRGQPCALFLPFLFPFLLPLSICSFSSFFFSFFF